MFFLAVTVMSSVGKICYQLMRKQGREPHPHLWVPYWAKQEVILSHNTQCFGKQQQQQQQKLFEPADLGKRLPNFWSFLADYESAQVSAQDSVNHSEVHQERWISLASIALGDLVPGPHPQYSPLGTTVQPPQTMCHSLDISPVPLKSLTCLSHPTRISP